MRPLVLLSIALLACGCSNAPVLTSPLPTEVLKNASEANPSLVAVTGRVEQDYDINNDNKPSGYILIDKDVSRSSIAFINDQPVGHDCFRLAPPSDSKEDVTLARLMKGGGTATVNGWLTASGGWNKIDIISIKEASKSPSREHPEPCFTRDKKTGEILSPYGYGVGENPGVLPPGSEHRPGYMVRDPLPEYGGGRPATIQPFSEPIPPYDVKGPSQ